MRTLSSIRDRLAKLVAAIPPNTTDHGWRGTSEEAIREVKRLLAEVEANPTTEPQPFNPADYSPEDAALILEVERMQKTMVWSDAQGCFVEPGSKVAQP